MDSFAVRVSNLHMSPSVPLSVHKLNEQKKLLARKRTIFQERSYYNMITK